MAEKKDKTAKAPAAKAKADRGVKTPKVAPRAKKAAAKNAVPPPAQAEKADRSLVEVKDPENNKVSEIRLHPEVFGVRVNDHLLYEAVKQYRAGGRRGTHMTKTRGLVSGTGKKPWKQKGTGRARIGSVRTPLWRHGGTVFGPVPRDYSYSMPRKARAAALRSALSQRVNEGALKVFTGFPLEAPKTKVLKVLLAKLGIAGKTTLVDHEPTDALVLSGRNIPDLHVVADTHLTVYDVLDCRNLVVSQAALDKLEERLTP
jgi:large subunit ribosomal protein L4